MHDHRTGSRLTLRIFSLNESAMKAYSPKLVTTSHSKHQPAPDQHGHEVDHIAQRLRVVTRGFGWSWERREKWSTMMSKLPHVAAVARVQRNGPRPEERRFCPESCGPGFDTVPPPEANTDQPVVLRLFFGNRGSRRNMVPNSLS